MLGDLDRQQSALAWLRIRPPSLPRIASWDRSDEKIARPPKGVTHVVLDSPAGIHGHTLKDALRVAIVWSSPCSRHFSTSTQRRPSSGASPSVD